MSTCYIHTGTPATSTCDGCGEAICETCRAKDREQPRCYLCVTRLEPPPEEPTTRIAGLDEAFPDVSQAGWQGDLAAAWRGGILGLIAACLIGVLWGLWDSLWDRTTLYAWVLAPLPVGAAVAIGTGQRHGWLPVTLGVTSGLLLIVIRTGTLMYRYALSDAEVARHFRKLPPWEQAAGVLIASLGSLADLQSLLFAAIAIVITAALATGLQLRRSSNQAQGTTPLQSE